MSKDLMSTIDDLLNEKVKPGASMTKKDTVINPQEKKPMKEEEQIQEFTQNADNAKNLTSDGKTADMATIKPSSGKESSEVAANKGPHDQAGENAGDEGDMNKGKIASDASAEVEADKGPHDQSTDNAGDTNSIDGISAKPSQASAEAEANKGPHDQCDDPGMGEQTEVESEQTVDEKKMDAVGQEDGDIDNDGDKDSSDEYLMKRRKAIAKAMKKEEVSWEDAMYILHAEELELTESAGAFDWNKVKDLDESQWYSLIEELSEQEEDIFAEELSTMAESLNAVDDNQEVQQESEETTEEKQDDSVEEVTMGPKIPAKIMPGKPVGKQDGPSSFKKADIEKAEKQKMSKEEAEEEYGRELTDEEYDHVCDSPYHLCAVVVEHPEWGEGKPIIGRHAEPDENGNIEWYDVEFAHGVEEEVPVEGMNIVHEMNHGTPKKKKGMKEYMMNKSKKLDVGMGEEKVDEALPAGDPIQKLAPAKGQDTTIQTGANDKQLPADDKKTAKGDAENKGGNPNEGPHSQAGDPNETPTTANPKGPAKATSANVGADANKGPHDQSKDPIVNKMPEETEQEIDPEAELDEDFKRKAAVVFETAVNEKVEQYKESLKEESDKALQEEKDSLNEKVKEYVDYAVKEWLKENELEIKYSLRTEVAENFIKGMKKLFSENYIEIPEEDIKVVDEISEQIESFKEQAIEAEAKNEKLQKEVLQYKKASIVETVSEGLTETQKIKLEKLSASVEADDTEEFQAKLKDLKEVYFNEGEESKKLLSSLSEEVIGTDEVIAEESNDSTVNAYAQFLTKTIKK